jgi:putative hydrolase of the HAD superfamily
LAYTKKLIKKGYRVACLSNGSHEWTLHVIENYGLKGLFKEIILSSDLGIVKPDPKIYMQTLQTLNISPSEAVFVDDRKENCDAAEDFGIRSIVFKDTSTFKDELGNLLNR